MTTYNLTSDDRIINKFATDYSCVRCHSRNIYKRATDPASRAKALVNLKSATHRYTLSTAAKKKYYSLIHSSSTMLESSRLPSSS